MSDQSNINDVLAEIEKVAIHTQQGSVVKVEDVRRLTAKLKQEVEESKRPEIPYRMTPEKARQAIRRDEELMKQFPTTPREPTRSISAQEPQPQSSA